jgi:hypothetical protein
MRLSARLADYLAADRIICELKKEMRDEDKLLCNYDDEHIQHFIDMLSEFIQN